MLHNLSLVETAAHSFTVARVLSNKGKGHEVM